ncbi:hypothetical protein LOZ54_006746, partial [Ophidiomyces ophidiicola]
MTLKELVTDGTSREFADCWTSQGTTPNLIANRVDRAGSRHSRRNVECSPPDCIQRQLRAFTDPAEPVPRPGVLPSVEMR